MGQVQLYTNKVLIVGGKVAMNPACCCGAADCIPCCENPWKLCVTVSDGTIVAQALVSIATTLANCCCSGTGTGDLCKTDGTNIGTVQVELLVTHDGTFARFTVTSAVLATCGAGCVSAWVEGTLTGTIPTNCTLSFTPTIARSAAGALTISATDAYTSCNTCCTPGCPLDTYCVSACAATYTVTVSGIVGDACCLSLNRNYTLPRDTILGGCNWRGGPQAGGPPVTGLMIMTLVCGIYGGVSRWRMLLRYNLFTGACGTVNWKDGSYVGYLDACNPGCPTGTYALTAIPSFQYCAAPCQGVVS